ncbi:hypothetical protein [Mesorhizobium sp. YM1C-6-2]|uniref:hypothetical protein n=1 Tax=Mesorhizobium sp. YM1C-6-2 TaxID=1827501 RepID=UPI000EF2548E|nr:hypothetical protein [Mesorhizobium sp. YM1C-6-2]RLP22279.1 hypothetical protein D8676_25420 [Mesorhizobium sp. YM1C-6-2]
MMALILLTCALAGGDCRPHVQADGLGVMECQIQSQRAAAQYVAEHPKRRIARIICADRRRIDFYLGRGQA